MSILFVIISYLIGSLPAGYFVVKYYKKEDIRTLGNGSIGATNVGRIIGKKGYILTFLLDFGKALIFIYIISQLKLDLYFLELSALAMIVGHIFPVFLKFKGGKGISVALGVLLAYNYILILFLLLVLGFFFLFIRKFTISGLIGFITLPVFSFLYNKNQTQLYFLILLNIIIIYAHRKNITEFIKQFNNKNE